MTVGFAAAERYHLAPGDDFHVTLLSASGKPNSITLHVVGVHAATGEFPPRTASDSNTVWTSSGFTKAHPDLAVMPITAVHLKRGMRDLPAFQQELVALGKGKAYSGFSPAWPGVNTQRAIHVQAVALWVLAGLIALAALLIVAQLLSRQGATDSDGFRELHTLGLTTRDLWLVGLARVVLIGAVAGLVAAAVAAVASPAFPVGLAGTAEPHPGFTVDVTALGLGAIGTLLVVALVGAWPCWRAAHRATALSAPDGAGSTSAVTAWLVRAPGVPVTTTTGVSFALDPGRGRAALPVRSTLATAIIGVAVLAGAVVFSSSLDHLLDTPRLYGANWDAYVTSNQGAGTSVDPALPVLEADPRVEAISAGDAGVPIAVNGVKADGIAVDAVRGPSLMPEALNGRRPTGDREVMLGTLTLATLHKHIGDTVALSFAEVPKPQTFTIVGSAVFPSLSDTLTLGRGTALTHAGLARLVGVTSAPPPGTALVRFRPGTDVDRAITELDATISSGGSQLGVMPAQQPVDVVNFGRVAGLPLLVGGVLALLALGTLVHLLVTAIRRRCGELAVLKVLGLVPRQLRGVVAWQATTVGLAALLVGLPLGVVLGRRVWITFAHQLGVISDPSVRMQPLGLVVVGVLAIANLAALVPARRAAATPAARVLRTG